MLERKTILVAEDDGLTRQFLAATLESELGLRVVAAADGEQALRLAEESRPDIILLDMLMPRLDGFEVARRLRHDLSIGSVPVLGMTGTERYEEALAAGCDEVIAKPLSVDFLVAEIARWLEQPR